jgi:hypothetical protein
MLWLTRGWAEGRRGGLRGRGAAGEQGDMQSGCAAWGLTSRRVVGSKHLLGAGARCSKLAVGALAVPGWHQVVP